MSKTILILAANPTDTSRLRLDQEVREIDNGLRRAQRREEFILKQIWAARSVDVRRAMLDYSPQIVHFCGHGAGVEGIAFENDLGSTQLINATTLSGFFELFADKVECVVLNACYSEFQAEAIAQHIEYVVGMKKGIGDAAAIEFAVAFYDGLGAGKNIEFAYKLACNAIAWANIPDDLVPALKSKSTKASKTNTQKVEINQSPANVLIEDDEQYQNYVESIVRSLSISHKGKVYRNKDYSGVKQPGTYNTNISLEVSIDDVLSLLLIVDCGHWNALVDLEHIQRLIQTKDAISAHKAICVSQLGFTKTAIDVAKTQGIGLWTLAEGKINIYAGGGLAAMSVGRRMTRMFTDFVYAELEYCGSYLNNLTRYLHKVNS